MKKHFVRKLIPIVARITEIANKANARIIAAIHFWTHNNTNSTYTYNLNIKYSRTTCTENSFKKDSTIR